MNTVDFYLRLSLEDGDYKDESNSIISQREILKDYISSREEFAGVKLREHIDDGYTGTNFNRPAFQKMIGLVKKNEIKTILVKDLSRFARDYIEAGAYIEQIFPFMQVRFISVNDNYDSNNNEDGVVGLDVPFRNLTHDYYSKDISQKMRSSVKVRQDKGYYFGSKAPYGYVKDEKDHHHLIVDKEVRHIVEEIFERYLGGDSMLSIAKDFNEREVLTPAKHIGLKRGSGIWTGQIVRYILTQRIYTGAVVGGKTRVQEVGSDNRKWVDKSKWIIREDMHEAIVSKEDFSKVQELLNRNEKNISRERKNFHILQDKVYCGKCHHKMSYTVHYGKTDGYCCPYRYKAKDCGCMKGKIKASILEDMVSKEIRLYTEHFLEQEQTRAIEYRVQESICESLLDRKRKLGAEKQKLQVSKMQLYEKHKQGVTDKETYLFQKEVFAKKIQSIEQEISIIEDKIKENTASEHNINVDKLREAVSKGELVLDWINEVIEKIYIYDKDKIEIVWKFKESEDANGR
ncbi:recombinase family protein [Streptococcus suis]|uniref:recombinase family protein n=1 Tax=Streptococcus suis TaxID=1307 RepID=UPI0003FA117C|nr:recombinase family protein [Streptococcus suis]MBS0727922.1 recombinase family protein [Streptococcus suis]MBS7950597.1 recombinase family protein [Streptococcus suis]MCL4933544.1 recombinase family protein [Streptococcus suis]MDE1700256.1 recombinase family protein [Streptococcus suis]